MRKLFSIILPIFLCVSTQVLSQQEGYITEKGIWFDLEVRVVDKASKRPIKNAYVSVDGKRYRYDIIKDYYLVKARVNQQLTVRHPNFETVYYTIKSNEEIKVEIQDFDRSSNRKRSYGFSNSRSNKNYSAKFFRLIDSANYYKSSDIEKSIGFIEEVLLDENSEWQLSTVYLTLANIYFYWKQYDLAIKNYRGSLSYREDNSTKKKLSEALILDEQFDAAEKILNELLKDKKFADPQKVGVHESLGDIFLKKKEYQKATDAYQNGLKLAEKYKLTSKITDINSKLGDVLGAKGDIQLANLQFANTLELAKQESPTRSISEKEKVANFYNSTQQLDKEIELRKETLEETKSIPLDLDSNEIMSLLQRRDSISEDDYDGQPIVEGSITYDSISKDLKFNLIPKSNDKVNSGYNAINSQSINYKIGRALVQKEDYEEAIPFLKKSIEDADSSKDLIVKKDATKKLSEVYENVGEYSKAYTTYRDYVNLVDTLYVRKQQEIEQGKRLANRIATNTSRITSLEKDKELNDSRMDLAMKDQQLSQARNKSQQYIIYTLLFGIAAMIVFAYLLFRSNKQQKLANNLLALKSMRSQMNPHFIFNALNSVNSFIAVNDERNANRYLSEFSVLMRSVLENSDEDFIPFSKEVELIELYVKLEHNRFKEKFEYEINVDKAIDLDEYSIPPMLLQPYIENAIWHGLRYKEEKGKLEVLISPRENGTLSVVIQDNGVGRKRSQELKTKNQLKQKSKGMSTIKKRISILNDMYQDRISVGITDLYEDGTGTRVELLLKRN